MGILNITPDSFHDGNRYMSESAILKRVESMIQQGADIIDVGGQSTRPGATPISAEEEWSRIGVHLIKLIATFPMAIFSIDTFYSSVARKAIDAGVSVINDVSAGSIDPEIITAAASMRTPYILMHMQGNPRTMQKRPEYKNVVHEVLEFFVSKIDFLTKNGIHDIIIDPGFGFGKTTEQNYELLKYLQKFTVTGYPILAGLSRKSMVTKILNVSPADSLTGTIALNTIALLKGASLLRVHDVKEAHEVRKIVMNTR